MPKHITTINQMFTGSLSILLSVGVWGCDSTPEDSLIHAENTPSATERSGDFASEASAMSDDELIDRIVEFRSNVNDGSVPEMQPDQAAWLLEALLNNQLNNPTVGDDAISQAFHVTLSLDDGVLSGDEIEAAYLSILNRGDDILAELDDPERYIYLYDVELGSLGEVDVSLNVTATTFIRGAIITDFMCDKSGEYPWVSLTSAGTCYDNGANCNVSGGCLGINNTMGRMLNRRAKGDGCDDDGYVYTGTCNTFTSVTPSQFVPGTSYPHPTPLAGQSFFLPQTPTSSGQIVADCHQGHRVRNYVDVAEDILQTLSPAGLRPIMHVFTPPPLMYTNQTLVYDVSLQHGRCLTIPNGS